MIDDEKFHQERLRAFDLLVSGVVSVLERFGRHDSLIATGDFAVNGDYCGYPQVKVSVRKLDLLRSPIIKELQAVAREFPNWEIVIAVAVRGHYDDWPDMGLYIRSHEIIDGLQRQYFPEEFQTIAYDGSRPGTEHD